MAQVYENQEKQKLKSRIKPSLIVLAAAVAAAVVVVCARLALNKKESMPVPAGAYYFAGGDRIELPANTALKRTEGVTIVVSGKEEENLKGYMIFQDPDTMLLQDDTLYFDRKQDVLKSVNCFTTLHLEAGEYRLSGKTNAVLNSGFLYDNKDLYVMLEPSVLVYGNEKTEVPPFSVVSVTYTKDVQVVMPGGEAKFIQAPGQDVSLVFEDGGYLRPVTDTYYQVNGVWRILYTAPSVLPKL